MAEQGTLQLYHGEKQAAIKLIKGFWKAHSDEVQTDAEALKDLEAWTAKGHRFYFICLAQEFVGFLHLGNRGGKPGNRGNANARGRAMALPYKP